MTYAWCQNKNAIVLVANCIKCPMFEDCKSRKISRSEPMEAFLDADFKGSK